MSAREIPIVGSQPTTKRDIRAVTEYLAVVPIAPGMFRVYNEDATKDHIVDLEGGACTCRDFQYRSPTLGDRGCKHIRRVRVREGIDELPPVPRRRIDPTLLIELEAQTAATSIDRAEAHTVEADRESPTEQNRTGDRPNDRSHQ